MRTRAQAKNNKDVETVDTRPTETTASQTAATRKGRRGKATSTTVGKGGSNNANDEIDTLNATGRTKDGRVTKKKIKSKSSSSSPKNSVSLKDKRQLAATLSGLATSNINSQQSYQPRPESIKSKDLEDSLQDKENKESQENSSQVVGAKAQKLTREFERGRTPLGELFMDPFRENVLLDHRPESKTPGLGIGMQKPEKQQQQQQQESQPVQGVNNNISNNSNNNPAITSTGMKQQAKPSTLRSLSFAMSSASQNGLPTASSRKYPKTPGTAIPANRIASPKLSPLVAVNVRGKQGGIESGREGTHGHNVSADTTRRFSGMQGFSFGYDSSFNVLEDGGFDSANASMTDGFGRRNSRFGFGMGKGGISPREDLLRRKLQDISNDRFDDDEDGDVVNAKPVLKELKKVETRVEADPEEDDDDPFGFAKAEKKVGKLLERQIGRSYVSESKPSVPAGSIAKVATTQSPVRLSSDALDEGDSNGSSSPLAPGQVRPTTSQTVDRIQRPLAGLSSKTGKSTAAKPRAARGQTRSKRTAVTKKRAKPVESDVDSGSDDIEDSEEEKEVVSRRRSAKATASTKVKPQTKRERIEIPESVEGLEKRRNYFSKVDKAKLEVEYV
ncbi:hypothetical protein HDU76_003699 [Blyttiomyces sp. JEL0837]|nr:hypothetical protein HDU76_003699 [Blyttiomyces sp. JEL0837]